MTNIKINESDARKILRTANTLALESHIITDDKAKNLVDVVFGSTHKTFKYILVTALLAKATDERANPICLQAGSSLPGAYDARNLCHEVLVKFEKSELGKALGGSNEPFLNKPARFTELDVNNPVRAGKDKEVLTFLCRELPLISSKEKAFNALVYALEYLQSIKIANESYFDIKISHLDDNAANLYRLIDSILEHNCEGEMITLAVAGLYELYLQDEEDYVIEVHPVNQSGASSKEISDLDIYKNNHLFVANELKDKAFSSSDVKHAADKVIEAGEAQLNFIVGRDGRFSQDEIDNTIEEYLDNNFIINVINIDDYVMTLISLIEKIDVELFVKFIVHVAEDTKFKETTIHLLKEIIDKHLNGE